MTSWIFLKRHKFINRLKAASLNIFMILLNIRRAIPCMKKDISVRITTQTHAHLWDVFIANLLFAHQHVSTAVDVIIRVTYNNIRNLVSNEWQTSVTYVCLLVLLCELKHQNVRLNASLHGTMFSIFSQHSTHWTPEVGKAAYICEQCKCTQAHTNTPHAAFAAWTIKREEVMEFCFISFIRLSALPVHIGSRTGSVGMVTRVRAEPPTDRGSIPVGGRRIFSSPRRPEWLWG